MGVAITKQEAVVMHLTGQLKAKDAEGNIRDISIGDLVKDGEQLIFGNATTFTLQHQDGSELTAQDMLSDDSQLPTPSSGSSTEQAFGDPDAEIAALQAQILAGEDPTAGLPETAAGAGASGNEGGSDFTTLTRAASETIAQAGYDTDGFAAAAIDTSEEDEIFEANRDPEFRSGDDVPGDAPNDDVYNFAPLNEGSSQGDIVGSVIADDADGDVLSYSFAGGSLTNGVFTIDAVTGVITLNQDIDDDQLGQFSLNVLVSDGNGGTDTAVVNIDLTNVNDPPEFRSGDDQPGDAPNDDVYNFGTLPEGSTAGTEVGTVIADDADGDVLSYSFAGGSLTNGVFTIDAVTGVITLNQDIDDDQLGQFSLNVLVSDGNGGTDTAVVNIDLTNVNDPPEFRSGDDQPGDAPNDDVYNFGTLPEGSTAGTEVGTVIADDADGDVLSYSFAGGSLTNGVFTIDAVTGVITLNQDIDDDQLGQFSLNVLVSDGNGGTDTAVINIDLTNVNDPPEFRSGDDQPGDAPNDDVYNFGTLPEGSTAGTEVGTVIADDADGDVLSYSFAGGSLTNGVFTIDAVTGVITLNQDIDDDQLGQFSLNVLVSDGNGGTDTAVVNIDLTNVNDPPEFRSGDDQPGDAPNDDVYNFGTLPEGSTAGTEVGTVIADDADGDVLSYSFAGGSLTNGVFTIDAVTGVITLNQDIDDDQLGQFSLNVLVSDGNGGTDTAVVNINLTDINDPPTTDDLSASGAEDAVSIAIPALSGNDIDGSVVSFVIDTLPANGTLYLNGVEVEVDDVILVADAANLTFTPDENWNGETSFDYHAVDNDGLADATPATVTITVTPVNDPPTTDDLSASGAEDAVSIAIPALSGNDIDGSVVSFVIDTLPANGTLYLNGVEVEVDDVILVADAANLTFTPDENWNGETSFDYHAVDNDGLADATPATVTITVTPVNDPPTTDDLSASGAEDAVSIAIPALSGNDIDGSVVSFVIDTLPANGTLYLNGVEVEVDDVILVADAANLTFTPDENWNGETSFDYHAVDNDGLADATPATVTITVTPVNDPPTTDDLSASGAEDAVSIAIPALSGNDIDGSVVSFVIDTLPANGTLYLNGVEVEVDDVILVADAANLTFTPDENWNGETSFDYHAVDNDGLADATPATVTITVTPVNDPPTTDDLSASGAEDAVSIAIPALSGNDIDGSVVSFVIDTLPANGTLYLNGVEVEVDDVILVADAANLTFTPDENWNGETSFDYHAVDNDGLADATPATVTITVTPVNDPPTTDDLSASGAEDAVSIAIPALSGNDIDGSVVSFVIDTLPANGTLYLNGVEVEVDDVILVADAANLTFTPDENWNGETSFDYHAVDNDGLADATPATVTITVTPVNDPPTTDDLSASGAEDAVSIAIPALSGNDIDGSVVSFVIDTLPANGTLYLNGVEVEVDDVILVADAANLTFTPDENWNGETSFDYHAVDNDGLADATPATVTITVTPVNDPPTTDDLSASGAEDAVSIAIPALSGNDIDGSVVSFVIDTLPANGTLYLNGVEVEVDDVILVADAANLTFTPDENWNGETSFDYHAVDNDGLADATPATVTITVTPVNDPPTTDDLSASGAEDAVSIAIPALSGNDIDGSVVSFVIDTLPANGTLYLNGVEVEVDDVILVADAANLTFTPDENWNGETSFDYHAVDNDGLADATPATVTITVTPVNDPPTTDDLSASGAEDAVSIAIPALSGNDIDGSVVSFVIDTLPANGTLYLNGVEVEVDDVILVADAANLTFTPDENWNGETSFDYHAVDNDGLADATPATVTITVTPVNDPPTTDDLSASGAEDAVSIAIPALSGNDIDGSVVSFVIDTLPANGTLYLNGVEVEVDDVILVADAANLTFTPDENWNGETSFDYHAVDNDGLADATPATVTITVTPVNDPPTTDDLSASGAEDAVSIAIPALSGNDIDGSVVSFVIDTLPANGTLYLNGVEVEVDDVILVADAANLTFTPDENWNGETSFDYHAVDNDGLADATPATVTITVTPDNDPPEFKSSDLLIVSEEGLTLGIADDAGYPTDDDDTTNDLTASGELIFTDLDSSSFELSSVTGPTDLSSGGVNVDTWTWSGNTLTGYAGTTAVLSITFGSILATANANEYSLSYEIELLAPIDHLSNLGEDAFTTSFGVTISDFTDSFSTDLQITIEDDSPIDLVDENADVSIINGSGIVGSVTSDLFNAGADGFGSVAFEVITQGLKFNGSDLTYTMNGSTLTATVGNTTVFTLTAIADPDNEGHYDYELVMLEEIELDSSVSYDISDAPAGNNDAYYVAVDGQIYSQSTNLDLISTITGTINGAASTINSNSHGIGVGPQTSLSTGEAINIDYGTLGTSALLVSLGTGNNGSHNGNSIINYTITYLNGGSVDFNNVQINGILDIEALAPQGDTILSIEIEYVSGDNFQVIDLSSNALVSQNPIDIEFAYTATDYDGDQVIFGVDGNGHFTVTVEPAANSPIQNSPLLQGESIDTTPLQVNGGLQEIDGFDPTSHILNLADVLLNEEHNPLTDYLAFSFNDGDTFIHIDTNGSEEGGDNLTIQLNGIDLSEYYTSISQSENMDEQMINLLLDNNVLIVDTTTVPIPNHDEWGGGNYLIP